MKISGLILNNVMSLLVFPGVMLLAAGDWRWWEGWVFGLWFAAMVIASVLYLYFNDPALLMERAKRPGSDNQKKWDQYLLSGIYLMAIGWYVIMPLDAVRFGWSPAFPLWLKILGVVVLAPALYLILRATVENTFMSALVRIQGERGQRVISTGVYGIVRHPLYLGCVLMLVGAPLLLGSLVGLGISLVGIVVLAVRILGEEKMLVTELDGYDGYMQKVRYRLIPFVW